MVPTMGEARIGGLLAAAWLCSACAIDEVETSTTESALDITKFVHPMLDATDRAAIVRQYDALDPTDEIPRGLLEDALVFLHTNRPFIPKTEWFVVIDLSKFSGLDRFWIVNTDDGSVEPHKTSHGDGSDEDHDGFATEFSNVSGSHMSSLGFYLTGEIYDGTHEHSMKLDGLTPDGGPNGMANTNARSRAIVVHEASYVNDDVMTKQGRSNGCPALDPSIEVDVVDRIHGGSLMYIATSSMAAPVGRATCGDSVCEGLETEASCATDCADPSVAFPPVEEEPESTGCATGGNGSLVIALALLGFVRRRRR